MCVPMSGVLLPCLCVSCLPRGGGGRGGAGGVLWYTVRMRRGKKTLYLDLDAVDRLEAVLRRYPGSPSVSAFLSDWMPTMVKQLEMIADSVDVHTETVNDVFSSFAAEFLPPEIVEGVKEKQREQAIMEEEQSATSVPPTKTGEKIKK